MAQRNPHWRDIDPPFWARRPAPRAKRFYDLEILPKLASRAGQARASDFGALPPAEQRTIITRLTVERIRAMARRQGKPEPIFVEAVMKPLPSGGYAIDDSKPMAPLRAAWGGDGRMLADALKEAKRTKPKDYVHIASLQLAVVAEQHRQKLLALGYTIEMTEAGIKIKPPAQPKRKAQKSAWTGAA